MRYLAVLLVLVGCVGSATCACPDSVKDAVLDKLYRKLTLVDAVQVNDSDYDPKVWAFTFKQNQDAITRIRKWAATLKDPCIRNAYNEYLDYYQNELNEARQELKTQAMRKDYAKFLADQKRADEAKQDYLSNHPNMPEPPEPK